MRRVTPLTPENAKTFRRFHPRCGTSYLLLVMMIAIIVYAFLDGPITCCCALGRDLLLPLIAGVSYEILKLVAKYDGWFFRAIRWPGLQLQRLTTKEPDECMLEVAIVAFEMALGEKSRDDIEAMLEQYDRSEKTEEPPESAEAGEETRTAVADCAEYGVTLWDG